MSEELSTSFAAANTALRAKRRALGRELSDFLRLARSGDLPTNVEFHKKKPILKDCGMRLWPKALIV